MVLRTLLVLVGIYGFLNAPHNLWAAEPDGYAAVQGPCNFVFPRDHGAHPNHRFEWWYYTGNLEDEQGRPFGFQFTIFRSRQAAPGSFLHPERPSPWRTEQVYLGHAAVSDIAGQRFLQADEAARGAVGLAGVDLSNDTVRVYFKDWQAVIAPHKHRIAASGANFSYAFELTPQKLVTAHGDSGYSRKGRRPESASCYYSITRFAVRGELILGKSHHNLTGTAWMDQEYSSENLEDDLSGWDWFSLHFEDGKDLMYFFLRQDDGSLSEASSGTLVGSDGQA
ncbi:MAG: lipocalin-like domain-containing protein, partial [Xanthomonadales bacterium]|nr:lipocalin-like domain-containing protein [Xanthomonadales bacterium]